MLPHARPADKAPAPQLWPAEPDIFALPRGLPAFLLAVDLGFLLYWIVSGLALLPAAWLYKDHDHPILQAWNLSFLPLDLLVSASGLSGLALARRGDARARILIPFSLALTCASGLQAVAFWALRQDFDPWWWAPNLALLVGPLWFLGRMLRAP